MLCHNTKEKICPKTNFTEFKNQLATDDASIKPVKLETLAERNLILVEDNPDLQVLYQMLLRKAGWIITGTAMDGIKALELYHSLLKKPTIIVLDILLPGCSGILVAKKILEKYPEQKILFLSGNCQLLMKEPDLKQVPYLSKPFEFRDLINKLEEMISNKKK